MYIHYQAIETVIERVGHPFFNDRTGRFLANRLARSVGMLFREKEGGLFNR
jgi:hypothetical protein